MPAQIVFALVAALHAPAGRPGARDRLRLGPDRLRALLARTPAVINTDRYRWLEFQTPKYDLDRRDLPAENLRWITGEVNPPGLSTPP